MLEFKIYAQKICLNLLVFISYNIIYFYKKIKDQHLCNKIHIINYTTKYICFMNMVDGSFLSHFNNDQVQYEAVSSFIASNFLLDD